MTVAMITPVKSLLPAAQQMVDGETWQTASFTQQETDFSGASRPSAPCLRTGNWSLL